MTRQRGDRAHADQRQTACRWRRSHAEASQTIDDFRCASCAASRECAKTLGVQLETNSAIIDFGLNRSAGGSLVRLRNGAPLDGLGELLQPSLHLASPAAKSRCACSTLLVFELRLQGRSPREASLNCLLMWNMVQQVEHRLAGMIDMLLDPDQPG